MDKGWFDPELMRALRFYSTISFDVAGAMTLGFIGGHALDERLGTRPWLAVSGFLLGAAAGFWGAYKLAVSRFHDRPPWP